MKNLKKKVMLSLVLGTAMSWSCLAYANYASYVDKAEHSLSSINMDDTVDASAGLYVDNGTRVNVAGNANINVTKTTNSAISASDYGTNIVLNGTDNDIKTATTTAYIHLYGMQITGGSTLSFNGGKVDVSSAGGNSVVNPTETRGLKTMYAGKIDVNGKTNIKVYSNHNSDTAAIFAYGKDVFTGTASTINVNSDVESVSESTGGAVAGYSSTAGGIVNINAGTSNIKVVGNDGKMTIGIGGGSGGSITSAAGSVLNIDVTGKESYGVHTSYNADIALDGEVNIKQKSASNDGYGLIANTSKAIINGKTVIDADGRGAVSVNGSYVEFNNDLNIKAGPDKDVLLVASNVAPDTLLVNKDGGNSVQLIGNLVGAGSAVGQMHVNLDTEDSFLTGRAYVRNDSLAELNLKLAKGAVWNMTGDSQLYELVNNSLVNMRQSGDGKYETLTVGTLNGAGTFRMDTDLQKSYDTKNVMGAGDKIIINQASSGEHVLDIYDASLNTNKKAEGYLLLVRDYSGGSATFTGGTLERGGIFKYKPIITSVEPGETDYAADYAVPDTVTTTAENGGAAGIATYSTVATPTVKNWYLTGYANPLDPVDPDDGDQGGQGGDGDQGGSVDPQPVDPADYLSNNAKFSIDLAHSRYVNYLMDHDTLLKRLGELRMVQQNKDEDNDGIWARFRKGSMTTDALDGDFKTYQLGYDKEITPQRRYVGAAVSHTDSSFDGSVASAEGDTTALSIYNTWLGEKSHYLDLVAKAGRMHGDSTYNGYFAEKGSYKTMFYSLSAEYGRKNMNDNGFYYEPQAQLTLGRINGDNYVTSRGTEVQQDAVNSVLGRVGVTFGKEFNMDNPKKHSNIYAKVNVLHEFAGDSKVTLTDNDGKSFTASKDYGGTWLNVGVGATANIGKSTNLYMDFEKNFGGEVKSNWIGQVGLRVSF